MGRAFDVYWRLLGGLPGGTLEVYLINPASVILLSLSDSSLSLTSTFPHKYNALYGFENTFRLVSLRGVLHGNQSIDFASILQLTNNLPWPCLLTACALSSLIPHLPTFKFWSNSLLSPKPKSWKHSSPKTFSQRPTQPKLSTPSSS